MSNNIPQTERLIDFLDGELNENQKKLLQQELDNNASIQQELDNLLLATEVIKRYGLASKVSDIHIKMMKTMATKPLKQPAVLSILYNPILRYAAGIILLVGLFSMYQYITVSENKLYQEKYNQYTLSSFRGSDTVSVIEKAFKESKYDKIIITVGRTSNPSVKDVFLTGQSYLINENYKEAISCFKTVLEKNTLTNSDVLKDDAEYYLALAYLKSAALNNALPIFKNIHNNKNHLYHEKVNKWFLLKLQLLKWKM